LQLDRFDSPVGDLLLAHDARGTLRALDFGDSEVRTLRVLSGHYGGVDIERAPAPASTTRSLQAYFDGDLDALGDIRVATGGTDFQRRVWAVLREIPSGTTRTYGDLAAEIGEPGAARAVGLANGANPVAIVVPCHRVIGSRGALTGFGGGLDRKRWLLEHEGVLLALR
jgi:O-6-methylguanine DNA methyltransferase